MNFETYATGANSLPDFYNPTKMAELTQLYMDKNIILSNIIDRLDGMFQKTYNVNSARNISFANPFLSLGIKYLTSLSEDKNTISRIKQSIIYDSLASIDEKLLTKEQRLALNQIIDHPSYINIISGVAGSGKSYLTKTIIDHLNNSNQDETLDTLILAPTHVAVTNITNAIKDSVKGRDYQEDPSTLSSLYVRHRFDTMYNSVKSYVPEHLMIIDEAFASSAHLLIFAIIYGILTKSYILLIGDPHQLPAIAIDSTPFMISLFKNKFALVTTPLRFNQRASSNGDIAVTANEVVTKKPLTKLRPVTVERLLEHTEDYEASFIDLEKIDQKDNLALISKLYWEFENKNSDADNIVPTVILTSVNKDRMVINSKLHLEFIQKHLTDFKQHLIPDGIEGKDHGVIFKGEPAIAQDTVRPANKNILKGGSLMRVQNTHHDPRFPLNDTISLIDQNHEALTYNLSDYSSKGETDNDIIKISDSIDYAYATTVHKVQGASISNVILYLPKLMLGHFRNNALYSALTRARYHLIILSTPEILSKTIQTSHYVNVKDALKITKLKNSPEKIKDSLRFYMTDQNSYKVQKNRL